MNWMKVIVPFAYASGLIAYILLLIMTIERGLSEGFSVASVIITVLGSIVIGLSFKELLTTSKELLGTLTKFRQK